jgi:fatty-acyl-CoA synthase
MQHFDPGLALELTETYRGVCFGGVPTMLTALLGHPGLARRDLSSLRYAMSGGAPVPADLVRRVEATLGIPFVTTFAQTESSCSITVARPSDAPGDRAETVGRPLPQTEVKVIDPRTGVTLAPGTTGEICTRGYLVMQGYLGDPEATGAAIDSDRWLHTGDLGSMDERGYCRIQGRIKEMIIRGGENVYPREIEAVLLSHPAVAEAAVVGVADRFWGGWWAPSSGPLPGPRPPRPSSASSAAAGSPPTRSPPAGCSPPASRSPPPARSARTCSARSSPTCPGPPGRPRPLAASRRKRSGREHPPRAAPSRTRRPPRRHRVSPRLGSA